MCSGPSVYLNPARGGNRKQALLTEVCPPDVMYRPYGEHYLVLVIKVDSIRMEAFNE